MIGKLTKYLFEFQIFQFTQRFDFGEWNKIM